MLIPSIGVPIETTPDSGSSTAPEGQAAPVSAEARRWRRFGKDRLYVSAPDGTKLGWLDLISGQGEVELPALADSFHAAIAVWLAGHPEVTLPATDLAVASEIGPAANANQDEVSLDVAVLPSVNTDAVLPTPVAEAGELGSAVEPAWIDLADRAAGAAAREQALSLRNAAPVRTFIARALGVKNDERAWRIGADGEERVAAQLQKLAKHDERWRFLHALPVGDRGSDIDHLVMGPGGVYSLNTKHHPGADVWVAGEAFMVNGHRQPYVRNSRYEAKRAASLLTDACGCPVGVTGVIVLVGAGSMKIKEPPLGVHVIDRAALVRWFRRQTPALDEVAIGSVFEASRRSTTWQPEGPPGS